MWYICRTPSSFYCWKQLYINELVHICPFIFKILCKIQSVSLSRLLKQQSSCQCCKTSSCDTSYIFLFKFKVHTEILKFIREINHDYNFKHISLRRQVCREDRPGRNYGGVERSSHIFVNIKLSYTDDLVTRPYDIMSVSISYVGLNISSVWHSNNIPISYGWLINSSVWHSHCCYLLRTT